MKKLLHFVVALIALAVASLVFWAVEIQKLIRRRRRAAQVAAE